MPTSHLMQLGSFRFSLSTAAYQELEKTTAYRWQSQDRVGRLPGWQFVGPGEDSITLSGVIYADIKANPTAQMDAMRAAASTGKPLMLVDGTGRVWHQWVIKRIRDTQKIFREDGTPRQVDFTMEIGRYGEDA